MIKVLITAENFKKMVKKEFDIKLENNFCEKISHGEPLAKVVNKENGEETLYLLKKIYIQKFDLKYSANHKVKKGGELLISSLKLPNVQKYLKKKV